MHAINELKINYVKIWFLNFVTQQILQLLSVINARDPSILPPFLPFGLRSMRTKDLVQGAVCCCTT